MLLITLDITSFGSRQARRDTVMKRVKKGRVHWPPCLRATLCCWLHMPRESPCHVEAVEWTRPESFHVLGDNDAHRTWTYKLEGNKRWRHRHSHGTTSSLFHPHWKALALSAKLKIGKTHLKKLDKLFVCASVLEWVQEHFNDVIKSAQIITAWRQPGQQTWRQSLHLKTVLRHLFWFTVFI
jgi:hypothetical protein